MSISLLSLIEKELPRAICSCRSLQQCDHEWITQVAHDKRGAWVIRSWLNKLLSKTSNLLEQIHIFCSFWLFFIVFSTFLCPRANRSRLSSLSCSLLKSDRSDLLTSLHSHRSLQKSAHERFNQVACDKRAMGAIQSFLRAN